MCRKQNFKIAFGFKTDTDISLGSFFSLSVLPSSSIFLPYFLSSAVHLVVFILVGKVFLKAFRILGLDERKGRWVVEFLWEFSGQC